LVDWNRFLMQNHAPSTIQMTIAPNVHATAMTVVRTSTFSICTGGGVVATGLPGICNELEDPDTTVTVAFGSPRADSSLLMLSADSLSGLAPITATETSMPARRRAGLILRILTLLGSTPTAAAIPSMNFLCAEASKSSTEIGSPTDRTIVSSSSRGGGGEGGGGGGSGVAVGEGGGSVGGVGVGGSEVADTFVADTFVADTFVADTFVALNVFVADTFVADMVGSGVDVVGSGVDVVGSGVDGS